MKFTIAFLTALFLSATAQAAARGTIGAAGGELETKSEGSLNTDGLTAGNAQVIRDVLIERDSALVAAAGGEVDAKAEIPRSFDGMTTIPIEEMFPGLPPDATLNTTKLDSRQGLGNLYCCPVADWGWGIAGLTAARQGVDYLWHNDKECDAGPRSCGRVSCSYGSAIYICNDNNYVVKFPCSYVAYLAQAIIDNCRHENARFSYVCGQKFDQGNFNVIIHHDDC